MVLSAGTAFPDSVSALGAAEQSGLFFLPTPGPGDSEGGEIYAPEISPSSEPAQPGTMRRAPISRAP